MTVTSPSSRLGEPRSTKTQLERLLPLAGVAFAVLSAAGNLTIGPFPDETTSVPELVKFYAGHHANVALGGTLLGYSTVFFGFFAIALWWRARRFASHVVAATVLLGASMVAVGFSLSADTYLNLGQVSTESNLSGPALQAMHVGGAVGGTGAGSVIFLLAIAAAGLTGRALPRWLSWSALVLGILHLTPLSFLAYLLFHLWAVAAGVALTLRPEPTAPALEPSGA